VSRNYTEITVVGDDDTGLIARVTTLLFERDINIEDLDQAVRDGVFRMTMHVDTDGMSCSEANLRAALRELDENWTKTSASGSRPTARLGPSRCS